MLLCFFRFDPCTDFAPCDVVFFILSTIGRNRMSAFDKIIGYDMVKGELRQLADCLNNTEKYRKMGVSIPCGLLLEGEP